MSSAGSTLSMGVGVGKRSDWVLEKCACDLGWSASKICGLGQLI